MHDDHPMQSKSVGSLVVLIESIPWFDLETEYPQRLYAHRVGRAAKIRQNDRFVQATVGMEAPLVAESHPLRTHAVVLHHVPTCGVLLVRASIAHLRVCV